MAITVETLVTLTKSQLGPTFKEGDDEVLKNLVDIVMVEALHVGNRMYETDTNLLEFQAMIVQAAVIAYENRGVEGQTRQGELGQENHFIDWHQYLRDEVVRHGKRYVI